MHVDIRDDQTDLSIDKSSVKKLAQAVVAFENREYDEVGIHFVDQKEICDLHEMYFQDPTLTDCISLPLDSLHPSPMRLMGDVFICPYTALLYCAKKESDPYQEVSLYIVHALLHLMGYDDMEKSVKRKMRAAEKRHMDHLRKIGCTITASKGE